MSLAESQFILEKSPSDGPSDVGRLRSADDQSNGKRLRVGFLRRQIDIDDGITSHCRTLITGLKKSGVDVVMLTGTVLTSPGAEPRIDSLKAMMDGWVDLDMPRKRFDVRPRHVSKLAQQIRDSRIDVLHLHGMGTLLLAKAAARSAGIPTVATVHLVGGVSNGFAEKGLRSMAPIIKRVWPNRLIAISAEIRQAFIERWGVPSDRVDLIFNGINTEYFRPPDAQERATARQQLGLEARHFVVAHVGRLTPVKGHDILLRAAALMPGALDRLRIICIGTGEKKEELIAMSQSLGIASNVQFLGFRDPLQVYQAADVLALPSRNEGFPLVVIEAMACGAVPVRTPTAGANDQISNGKNGYIFPFEDHQRLAELLSTLMAEPDTASRLGLAAIETARTRFDAGIMTSKTLETYQTAIASGSRRRNSVR